MATKLQLEKALIRAVFDHGHTINCSALRGMDSDCHCGWSEVKRLAVSLSAATHQKKLKKKK